MVFEVTLRIITAAGPNKRIVRKAVQHRPDQ
jgi:hypothetical protein